jgi:hypothetical protein
VFNISPSSQLYDFARFIYIFGSVHAMKTTILPLDSVKQNLIPNDTVLVKCPQIYIIKLFMTFVFFEGSSGIIFTYHFRNIRTRMLNTIYRVLFSGLCVQIFIFYFGIYRIKSIFIFLARYQAIKTKHSTCQSTPSGSGLHVHLACVAGGIRGHERTGRLK